MKASIIGLLSGSMLVLVAVPHSAHAGNERSKMARYRMPRYTKKLVLTTEQQEKLDKLRETNAGYGMLSGVLKNTPASPPPGRETGTVKSIQKAREEAIRTADGKLAHVDATLVVQRGFLNTGPTTDVIAMLLQNFSNVVNRGNNNDNPNPKENGYRNATEKELGPGLTKDELGRTKFLGNFHASGTTWELSAKAARQQDETLRKAEGKGGKKHVYLAHSQGGLVMALNNKNGTGKNVLLLDPALHGGGHDGEERAQQMDKIVPGFGQGSRALNPHYVKWALVRDLKLAKRGEAEAGYQGKLSKKREAQILAKLDRHLDKTILVSTSAIVDLNENPIQVRQQLFDLAKTMKGPDGKILPSSGLVTEESSSHGRIKVRLEDSNDHRDAFRLPKAVREAINMYFYDRKPQDAISSQGRAQ